MAHRMEQVERIHTQLLAVHVSARLVRDFAVPKSHRTGLIDQRRVRGDGSVRSREIERNGRKGPAERTGSVGTRSAAARSVDGRSVDRSVGISPRRRLKQEPAAPLASGGQRSVRSAERNDGTEQLWAVGIRDGAVAGDSVEG